MGTRFTTFILVGMLLGVAVGSVCNVLFGGPKTASVVVNYLSLPTTVFLRLIKMIIAPLDFFTLVIGIVHMGDTASIGRIGMKTMGWFVCASVLPLLVTRHHRSVAV